MRVLRTTAICRVQDMNGIRGNTEQQGVGEPFLFLRALNKSRAPIRTGFIRAHSCDRNILEVSVCCVENISTTNES